MKKNRLAVGGKTREKTMFDIDQYNILYRNHVIHHNDETLRAVRSFLNASGMHMPPPLYTYEEKDVTTWRYLDGYIMNYGGNLGYGYRNRLNPSFKYAKLLNSR